MFSRLSRPRPLQRRIRRRRCALVGLVIVFSCLSFFSPVDPRLVYRVPPDIAPNWQYWFGTNSRGQDMFWQLTFAFRNTLTFGLTVALLSRVISIVVGLAAGYIGGWVDRVLMFFNDIFVAIPIFPILILFYFVMKSNMNSLTLALVMACFGWPYDARLIRSVAIGLRLSRVHAPGRLCRHVAAQDHVRGALALCDADHLLDRHGQHDLVDRAGGDARRARLHQSQRPDGRHDALLGEQPLRAGGGHLVVDRSSR